MTFRAFLAIVLCKLLRFFRIVRPECYRMLIVRKQHGKRCAPGTAAKNRNSHFSSSFFGAFTWNLNLCSVPLSRRTMFSRWAQSTSSEISEANSSTHPCPA